MDLELKGKITTATEDIYKIELTRGQKGTYGWTITSHGFYTDDVLNDIGYIDEQLRRKYLPPVTPSEET